MQVAGNYDASGDPTGTDFGSGVVNVPGMDTQAFYRRLGPSSSKADAQAKIQQWVLDANPGMQVTDR